MVDEPRHPFGYAHIASMLEGAGFDVSFINEVDLAATNESHTAMVRAVVRTASAFDAVICYSTTGTVIASLLSLRLRRPRVVVYLQSQINPGGAFPKRLLRRLTWRWAVANADAVVSVLWDVTEEIRRRHPRRAHRVFYSPVGADTKFFDPALANVKPQLENLNVASKQFLLVVGDYTRDDAFIFESLQNRKVPIVRITRDQGVYERVGSLLQLHRRSDDVLLRGVSFADLRWLYANATAVLFAADDSWEPAGITALTEALATGAVCIANAGGCIEREMHHLAEEHRGALPLMFYPYNHRAAFAEAVDRCVQMSAAEHENIAAAARRFAIRACPVERAHDALLDAVCHAIGDELHANTAVSKQVER